MSYIEVSKGKFGASSVPHGVLRVSRTNMALAENLSEQFQLTRTDNPASTKGREIVKLGVAVDKENKRIKLLPTAINGFTWGANGNNKVLTVATPKSFWRMGVPAGDYICTNTRTLEFELAE